jgi:phage-related protein
MTVIGSAYVNIRAITDKLERDIRSAIESINDSITIHVDADVSSATAQLADLADSQLEDQTLTVDADTSSAQRSLDDLANTVLGDQTITVNVNTEQAVSDLQNITNLSHLQDQTVHIGVDTDPRQAIIDLHEIANQSLRATVQLEADTLAARREIDDMLDDMGRSNPTVTPDVDDEAARARLALLTRMRQLRVNVVMNSGPLVAAGNAIARMTGARVLAGDLKKMADHFINIDKAVPGIAKMAVMLGSIGGAAISSIGGLSTLAASLGSIISMAAIAAPGMATGFLVGIGTLIVALKDFGKQLPEVTAQYKTLGNTIKSNFWDVARNALRDMSQTLFPQFQEGLASTARALGGWTEKLAEALKVHLDNNVIVGMFGFLSKSIDIASQALEPLVQAFVELGWVGGELLPRLATWFVEVSNKFSNFINAAASNGDLRRWIEEGITNLKRLGSIVAETAGIFSGITDAARAAGSDGLGTLLSFVDRLNTAVNSPEGIKALTTIFQGANAVASSLGDAFFKLFGAIGSAAPTVRSALESIAGVIKVVSDAIAAITSNPEFQAGFAAMFDGIQKGFEALAPVVGTMGPKMGAFLSIIGSLAANIGGVLAAALEVALPLITALKQAIDPLIPVLGDALIQIIQALKPAFDSLTSVMLTVAPAITSIIQAVAPFIAQVVETLGPALPAIIAGVVGFAAAWKATVAIQGIISGITTAMAAYRAGMTLATAIQTGFNIAALANPVALVIAGIVAGIAALVAGVIWAYNNVGWFKDGIDAAFKFIGEVIGNIVSFWNTNVVPMFEGATKAAGDFFGGIGKWVGEAITFIQGFFGNFGGNFEKGLSVVGDGIGNFFGGIADQVGQFIGGIVNGVADFFRPVVDFISNVINTIVTIISTGVQMYIGIWVGAFNFMADVFRNIWNGIVWFFEPLVNLITSIIQGAVDIITAIWTAAWEIISTIFIGIWTNLVRFFTPIIQSISDTITTIVNAIVSTWNSVWQGIVDFFTTVWNQMVAIYSPIIQSISDTITGIVNGVRDTWNAVWQGIVDYFTTIWNLMVAIYSPIINGIRDTIVNIVNGISDTWNSIWSGISNFFSTIWNNIVSFVSGAIQNVSNTINNVVNGINNAWNSTWSAIGNFVRDVWNNIVNGVSGFVNEVQRNIQNVLDTIGRIGSDILNNIGNFGSLLLNAGRDLIDGLAQGIRNASGAIVDTIKNIAAGALDTIKNFFGIKSPSRVMRDQVGKQLGAGLAIGIESMVGRVKKATATLAEAAVPEIADIMLPAVKTASQKQAVTATVAPVLSRDTVTGTSRASTGTGVFGQSGIGGVTNVNFTVNPSQGLNETQIGEAAMNHMYWKLSTSN